MGNYSLYKVRLRKKSETVRNFRKLSPSRSSLSGKFRDPIMTRSLLIRKRADIFRKNVKQSALAAITLKQKKVSLNLSFTPNNKKPFNCCWLKKLWLELFSRKFKQTMQKFNVTEIFLHSVESNAVEVHGYADYNGEQYKNYNFRLKECYAVFLYLFFS